MARRDDVSGPDGASKRPHREASATPVLDLGLSVRALRVVGELGIETIGDLAKLTPEKLSGRRNCGHKTIAEIVDLCERFGTSLQESHVPVEKVGPTGKSTNPDTTTRVVVDNFDGLPFDRIYPLLRRVDELNLSTRAHNSLRELGVMYTGDLVQLTRSDLLGFRNFGRKSLREVETVLGAMGLSLNMILVGWDHDLAGRLENKFEAELKAGRLQQIRRRFSALKGENRLSREGDVAADRSDRDTHGTTQVSRGWRVKRKSEKPFRIEAVLLQLLRSLTSRRNAEMLQRFYGWDGLGPRTLESVGREYEVTRERVRQIAARFEKRHRSWLNIGDLDLVARAVSHVRSRCPCRADLVEREFCDLKISERPFRVEGLLSAWRFLDGGPPFEVALIEDVRFVILVGTAGVGRSVLQIARQLVEHWGCTTLEEVCEQASTERDFVEQLLGVGDDFEWLDQDRRWFWLRARPRNRLLNQIQKVLSVTNPIDVGELRDAVGRHHRMAGFAPPREVLLQLCDRASGYGVTGRKVSAWPPINPATVLSENEMTLFRVLKRLGSVASKDELEENCIGVGMNRNSFNIYLSYSPIIARYDKGVYGLIGSEEVSAGAVEALRAPAQAKRALLDHGWTPDGRIWVAYRLSRSNLGSGLFHVPAAIREFIEGNFKLQSAGGNGLGELKVRDGTLWGLGKVFERRGGEVGDTFVACFNATTREASIEIDGFELLDRYASGSDELVQSVSSSGLGVG
jgi:Bacterial RNA polymerase, alpha chain C terminal domain